VYNRHFLRFPGSRIKAVTLSYDDGRIPDLKLMGIIDKYGVKCTFNIPSENLESNVPERKSLSCEDVIAMVNEGKHELAIHGARHICLAAVPKDVAANDIITDRKYWEKLTGTVVKGMAYACGSYDAGVEQMLADIGIEYARTTECTEKYDIPTDWLAIKPTCKHMNPRLMDLAEKFIEDYPENMYYWSKTPKLFYLWGHSFEYARDKNWDVLEDFCKIVGNRDDVWYCTNGELYAYVKAFDSLRFSMDGKTVQNPSGQDIYLNCFGNDYVCPANGTVKIE